MEDILPLSFFPLKKYFDELQAAVFSIVNKDDPYLTAKQLHLQNWCRAFLLLFICDHAKQRTLRAERLPFFLDILSDEECWEETDAIHRVTLKRRVVAKKIVQCYSRSGILNPLDYDERYRVACWCCLEEDIFVLFEHFKQKSGIRTDDSSELNKLVGMKLSSGRISEPLTIYWSYIAGGLATEIKSEGMNLLEYGLELAFAPYVITYVEAVEFFWNRIISTSENELSEKQKYEIILKIVSHAAGPFACDFPEVFEYCIRQLSPKMYLEFLKMEYNKHLDSLRVLQKNLCFDQFQKLFDCVDPINVSKDRYYSMLKCLGIPEYSGTYANEAAKLFMHVWLKEGFDKHRNFVLDAETGYDGRILVPLVKKNYMELVWALLDKVSPHKMKMFINSITADNIVSELHLKGDNYSLKKFLYNYATREIEEPGTSLMGVDVNSKAAKCLASVMHQRSDQYSLSKFSSYKHVTRDYKKSSTSLMDIDANSKKGALIASKLLQRHDQYSLNNLSYNYLTSEDENQFTSGMEVAVDLSESLPKRLRK